MPAPYAFSDLLQGASISQLSELFELDRRTVTERLRNLPPCGRRAGFAIYKVLDAAPLLLERYVYSEDGKLVRNDKRKDEPEKDYWDARLKEQKYLENAGDLWRTDKVIIVVSEILRLFRESMTVFLDNLEFDSGLPAANVAKAKVFGDNLLVSCRQKLLELQADALGPVEGGAPGQGSAKVASVDPESAQELGDDEDFSDIGL